MKTHQTHEIGGARTLPHLEKNAHRLFYEVDFLSGIARIEFSHSLSLNLTSLRAQSPADLGRLGHSHITKADTIIYRANQSDCATCPMKSRCCPNTLMRKIARSIHESARDVAREIAKTDPYKQSRKDRKKVEMLFAHLKRILKLDRLRLRGLSGAQDEFLLAATAQNRRRMAKRLMPGNATAGLMPA